MIDPATQFVWKDFVSCCSCFFKGDIIIETCILDAFGVHDSSSSSSSAEESKVVSDLWNSTSLVEFRCLRLLYSTLNIFLMILRTTFNNSSLRICFWAFLAVAIRFVLALSVFLDALRIEHMVTSHSSINMPWRIRADILISEWSLRGPRPSSKASTDTRFSDVEYRQSRLWRKKLELE